MDDEKFILFINQFVNSVKNYNRINKKVDFFTMKIDLADGTTKTVLSKAERTPITGVSKRVRTLYELNKMNNPVSVILEAFDENGKSVHLKAHKFETETPTKKSPLDGLGEAQIQDFINDKINKGLEAERKARLEEEKNKELEELRKYKSENEKLIEELEAEVEELQGKLDLKNKIEAVASNIGALLENVGIPREKLGGALGGLLGVSKEEVAAHAQRKRDEEQQEHQQQNATTEQSPREKVFDVINESLYALTDDQLSKVYMIIAASITSEAALTAVSNFSNQYLPKQ